MPPTADPLATPGVDIKQCPVAHVAEVKPRLSGSTENSKTADIDLEKGLTPPAAAADAPAPTVTISSEPPAELNEKAEADTRAQGPYGAYNEPVLPPNTSKEFAKVVGDQISLAGGLAAVLLQIAHPIVGAGVAANSSFITRPIGRARRTNIYIYVQAFGTPEERKYITDMTHKSHSHVNGMYQDKPAEAGGFHYDANMMDAQLWVAATIYWSMIASWENIYGKLNDEKADVVYKEFSCMGTALRVPASMWPKTRKDFDVYFQAELKKLKVLPEALETSRYLLHPRRFLPWWVTVLLWWYAPLARLVTQEMLVDVGAEDIARAYGMKPTKGSRKRYNALQSAFKLTWPAHPKWYREGLKNYSMKDMRKRMKEGRKW
jgi:uncharacterized protein (DUF2236 family)